MEKIVMGVQIDNRFADVPEVQEVFTEYGCIIKTRIGLHQQTEFGDKCTNKGLILLELNENTNDKSTELEQKLTSIEGVNVKKMIFH